MKNISILTIVFLWSGLLIGQYLVIDSTNFGGISIPFQDTTISSKEEGFCTTTVYYADLDQDTINDVKFFLECYMGGWGQNYYMSITPQNIFSVHIDTNYLENFQYVDSNGTVQDSVRKRTVIKKYMWGDTIYANQLSSTNTIWLLRYIWGYINGVVYENIDLFLEDTSYIAFTKNNEQNSSIYYLKIYVPSKTRLKLISAKTDDPLSSIDEKISSPDLIFPNPVSEKIYFKGSYDIVEIFTLQGNLILSERVSNTQEFLDVSWMQSGYYIIKLKNENTEVITKIIKL